MRKLTQGLQKSLLWLFQWKFLHYFSTTARELSCARHLILSHKDVLCKIKTWFWRRTSWAIKSSPLPTVANFWKNVFRKSICSRIPPYHSQITSQNSVSSLCRCKFSLLTKMADVPFRNATCLFTLTSNANLLLSQFLSHLFVFCKAMLYLHCRWKAQLPKLTCSSSKVLPGTKLGLWDQLSTTANLSSSRETVKEFQQVRISLRSCSPIPHSLAHVASVATLLLCPEAWSLRKCVKNIC